MKPTLYILIALSTLTAHSTQFLTSSDWNTQTNAILTQEHWVATDILTFSGTSSNDFYFAAAQAQLSGTFQRDLTGIAQSLDYNGTCKEDLRIATHQRLLINGQVGNNLMARSDTVILGTNSIIGGDAHIIAQTVSAQGIHQGTLTIDAPQATLSGTFHGDVILHSSNPAIMQGTEIHGNLTYTDNDELFLNDHVILHGELIHKRSLLPNYGIDKLKSDLTRRLLLYGAALFTGIPLLILFPLFTSQCIPLIQRQRGRAFFTGLAGLFFLITSGLFTISTIIGIPFALLCIFLALIILYLGHIISAMAIGTLLLQRSHFHSLWQMITALSLGLLIIYILTILPLIGTALWITATLIGSGAIILHLIQTQRKPALPPRETTTNTPFTNNQNKQEQ